VLEVVGGVPKRMAGRKAQNNVGGKKSLAKNGGQFGEESGESLPNEECDDL
jgi:hypothetical protein